MESTRRVNLFDVIREITQLDVSEFNKPNHVKAYIVGHLCSRYLAEPVTAERKPSAYWQWTGTEYMCSVCGFRTTTPETKCPICEEEHAMPREGGC